MLCTLLVGCTVSEEEDHLEHHIPAHKPKTYAEAVTQLEQRFDSLQLSADAKDPTAIQEFGDIIGWIPEISADSDLDRKDWEQVQTHWKVLDPWFANFAQQGGKISTEQAETFRSQLRSLQEYVDASDRPPGGVAQNSSGLVNTDSDTLERGDK